jgi:hypothetical protein
LETRNANDDSVKKILIGQKFWKAARGIRWMLSAQAFMTYSVNTSHHSKEKEDW